MNKRTDPSITVGVFVFNQKKELLLLKSHKWKNLYVIPGGHIEKGETIKQACQREVKEETGLNIYGLKFINVQEAVFDKQFFKKRHFIFLDYLAFTKGQQKVKLNKEAQSYCWVSLKQALKLSLNTFTRKAIKEIEKLKLLN